MKTLLLIFTALVVAIQPARTSAARIELKASEITSIQPGDSSASPRLLVKWSLPEELADKSIDAAFVSLTLAVDGELPLVVDMSPLTRSWSATEVSWSAGWTEGGGDFDERWAETVIVTEGNGGAVTMDVRHLVREQIAGKQSNFGFILIPDETADASLRPCESNASAKLVNAKLSIVYRSKRQPD